MCTGGTEAGGSCGLRRAGFGTWFGGTTTTSGSSGGLFVLAWLVALVFVGLCTVGGFGAGGPLSAISVFTGLV